jgi:protein-L-isoaspartate(D-aspartate) O-methyltransferase
MSTHAVLEQLASQGIRDVRVLAALGSVPREQFAADASWSPTPSIIAVVARALSLRSTDRVFVVGTDSAYAAAVLSELAGHVAVIGDAATRDRLARLGYRTVAVLERDDGRPYDAIAVFAAAPYIPENLLERLRPHGRLAMPLGDTGNQTLVRARRTPEGDVRTERVGWIESMPMLVWD